MPGFRTLPFYGWGKVFGLSDFYDFYSYSNDLKIRAVSLSIKKELETNTNELSVIVRSLTGSVYPSIKSPGKEGDIENIRARIWPDRQSHITMAENLARQLRSPEYMKKLNEVSLANRLALWIISRKPELQSCNMPVSKICFLTVTEFIMLQVFELCVSDKHSEEARGINNAMKNLQDALGDLLKNQCKQFKKPSQTVAIPEIQYALGVMDDVAAQAKLAQDFAVLKEELEANPVDLDDRARVMNFFQRADEMQKCGYETSKSLIGEYFNPVHLVVLGVAEAIASRMERRVPLGGGHFFANSKIVRTSQDNAVMNELRNSGRTAELEAIEKGARLVSNVQQYLEDVGLKTTMGTLLDCNRHGEVETPYVRPQNSGTADFYMMFASDPKRIIGDVSESEIMDLVKGRTFPSPAVGGSGNRFRLET